MGLYLGAFSSYFENLLQNMSDLVGNSSNNYTSIKKASLLKTGLIVAMKFHDQAKEWERHTFSVNHSKIYFMLFSSIFTLCRGIMSGTVFFQLTTAALYMACSIFELEMVSKLKLPFSISIDLIKSHFCLSCLGRQIIGYKNMRCDAQHPHEHWKYIVMLFCGLICDRKVLALRCHLVWINVVQVSRRFTEICAADYIRRATTTGFWWTRTHATGFDGVLKGTGSIITTN